MLITAQLKDGSITVLPMTVETLVLLRKHGQVNDHQLEEHLALLRVEAEARGEQLDETPVTEMRARFVEGWIARTRQPSASAS